MNEIRFEANNLADTDRLGKCLASVIPDGTTVALIGTLGSGKTYLVQAIAEACGIDRGHVVSPTFVLCQPYHGQRLLFHMDAYRIADDDEFMELGPDEYFDSDGVTLIEWADRVQNCLPTERIEIHIEVKEKITREFRITATSSSLAPVLEQIAARLATY